VSEPVQIGRGKGESAIKVSDYIADFLSRHTYHVFLVTGAHALHLVDSICRHPDVEAVCMAHEQGAAFAADAYARISRKLGVAMATSGPGAVNLLSGACSAYFDRVPLLLITGQVATAQFKGDLSIRQRGFQETDVVNIFRPVTVSARLVDKEDIRWSLEQAVAWAKSGPVLLDIPDDVQRAEVDPETAHRCAEVLPLYPQKRQNIEAVRLLLAQCRHPVVVMGAGVWAAHAVDLAWGFVESLGFPALLTWGGMDLLPWDHPLNMGGFGVCGPRAGNFAVQNADLVLCLGTRMDTHMTGPGEFAPKAVKIVVDCDQGELDKFPFPVVKINSDLKEFLLEMGPVKTPDTSEWLAQIQEWREKYAIGPQPAKNGLDPYGFILALSKAAGRGDIVVTDAGATLVWMMQTWRRKPWQRIISAWNHSPMGYALPGAIGAACAGPGRTVICLTGDGSFQMNIQELATLSRMSGRVKVFVIDNSGYGIIRQTQDTWLEGRHLASCPSGGLGSPDLEAVSRAYGLPTKVIDDDSVYPYLGESLDAPGPAVFIVKIDPEARIIQKLAKGKSLEDLD
jgi:acetolactate synthase I/II/III large subunit